MRFEQTPLWTETQRIMNEGESSSYQYIRATVRAGDQFVPVLKVLTYEVTRDYELGFADEILLEIMTGVGSSAKVIYPNKDQITITVEFIPIVSASGGVNLDREFRQLEYKAVLLDTGDLTMEEGLLEGVGVDELDLADIVSVKFQLISKSVEQLRAIQVGGTYRNIIPGEFIRSQLDLANNHLELEDIDAIVGVDHVPYDNMDVREHIVVPHGTTLSDLPYWIQSKGGGVYNAGLGCYLQDNNWYLYPCYRPDRYDEVKETLNIINVPPNQLPNIERTHLNNDGSVSILTTGTMRMEDVGEIDRIQNGNGERFIHSDSIYGGGIEVKGNRLTVARARRGTEMLSSERRDGFNRAPVGKGVYSSNPFVNYSNMAKRNGSVATVVWENSNPELLYPGQPVQLSYMKEGLVVQLRGVLLGVTNRSVLAGKGITSTTHRTDTALIIFVEKPAVE